MSMDLKSDSGSELNPSGSAWSFYLRLAEAYGWKPAGSLPPEGVKADQWEGAYDTNDGQRVTKEDAVSMAAALDRVLADPNGEAKQREVNRTLNEDVRTLMKELHGIDLPPEEDDDEEIATPEDLRALVTFLRAGSFVVE
jgi:hypothetical protein